VHARGAEAGVGAPPRCAQARRSDRPRVGGRPRNGRRGPPVVRAHHLEVGRYYINFACMSIWGRDRAGGEGRGGSVRSRRWLPRVRRLVTWGTAFDRWTTPDADAGRG